MGDRERTAIVGGLEVDNSTLSPLHTLWRRTYSLWLSSFRRFTRSTLTLFTFLLGGVAGASKFEKFIGEVAIRVGHDDDEREGEVRTERGLGVSLCQVVTVRIY